MSVQNDHNVRQPPVRTCGTTQPVKKDGAAESGCGCSQNGSGFFAGIRDELSRRAAEGRAESKAAIAELERLQAEPRAKGFLPQVRQFVREIRVYWAI